MTNDFKLIGLSRKKSMTCVPLDKEDCFWPKVEMEQDRFDALWNYFSTLPKQRMVAEIKHEGIDKGGIPKNPIVVSVRDWDL